MGSITERIVYGERYDAIYVKTNKRFGVVEYLAKLVPHDGYKLYAVNADYRPAGRGVTWYYVIARNAREARTIFNRCVSWLNIFTYDGKPLANAYYHWSAYTGSSMYLTMEAIKFYNTTREINPLRLAVSILQQTGAGVNAEERMRINADKTGRFDGIEFKDAKDRNTGLLAVTEEGMNNTRYWEEGRVTIDIGEEVFYFGVCWEMEDDEFEECRDPGDALALQSTDFDFDAPCPFRDIEKMANVIKDNPDGVRIGENRVLCWIE